MMVYVKYIMHYACKFSKSLAHKFNKIETIQHIILSVFSMEHVVVIYASITPT